jgi:GTP cyclohydrolase I
MKTNHPNTAIMPDVANETQSRIEGSLDKVGMEKIEIPVLITDEQGQTIRVPAMADAFVDLADPKAKGIHMSRLYLQLQETLVNQPVTPETLKALLVKFLETHTDVSTAAYLRISYEYMTQRPALVSGNSGWRSYPITLTASATKEHVHVDVELRIVYSSTCPCSAALARQLVQHHFLNEHSDRNTLSRDEVFNWLGKASSIIATPHAQRSYADIKVRLHEDPSSFCILTLINLIEDCLKTVVQTAVKREDEQEFARLNGTNLMFCEDAARKVQKALVGEELFTDFVAKVQHLESLHPHDAVAIVTKGIPGGFTA